MHHAKEGLSMTNLLFLYYVQFFFQPKTRLRRGFATPRLLAHDSLRL